MHRTLHQQPLPGQQPLVLGQQRAAHGKEVGPPDHPAHHDAEGRVVTGRDIPFDDLGDADEVKFCQAELVAWPRCESRPRTLSIASIEVYSAVWSAQSLRNGLGGGCG